MEIQDYKTLFGKIRSVADKLEKNEKHELATALRDAMESSVITENLMATRYHLKIIKKKIKSLKNDIEPIIKIINSILSK